MNRIQAKLLRLVTGIGVIGCLPLQLSAQNYLAYTHATIETVSEAGAIEDGTLLIFDGKIAAVGPAADVSIPITAQIVDAHGKTLMPGIVDPYFVVDISRNSQPSSTRTVTFGGRTIVVGGGSPAVATTFAKISDAFEVASIDWAPGRRSGITTFHVVTGGYAQSLLAELRPVDVAVQQPDGKLLLTVTNSTSSLDVLRNGLKGQGGRSGSSANSASGRSSGSRGGAGGGPPPSRSGAAGSTSASPTEKLWSDIRAGKSRVFVNVNNAASILHVESILQEQNKAQLALIASGEDVLQTLESLDSKRDFVIMSPSIDLVPNSANRANVPLMLVENKINFAFSLSLGQSNFRDQQDAPLFAVAMLIRGGLDRDVALKALTASPAKLLGIESKVGTLEVGKVANLIVLDGDPFATTTGICQVIVEGKLIDEN
jgi:imidazolonepropionase-like amidohydrolase